MLSDDHLITLAAVEISEGQMEEYPRTSSSSDSKERVCFPAWTPIPMLSPVLSMALLLARPIHLWRMIVGATLILVAVAEMM